MPYITTAKEKKPTKCKIHENKISTTLTLQENYKYNIHSFVFIF